MSTSEVPSPRVLAIDDDPDIHKWLMAMFGDRYTIDAVLSVSDAFDALAATCFDLLIVDQDLEDGYGTDVLEHLRDTDELPTPRDVPAIMLTASRDADTIETSHFLGSLAYVRKPINYEELASALESALATGAKKRPS
jgi:DNA-binding NtrC family response regulator